MKNILKTGLALLLVSAFTLGCKKDKEKETDENNPPQKEKKNEGVYDGDTFAISQSYIMDYSSFVGTNSYNFDLELFSGIDVYVGQNEIDSIKGFGKHILLEMWSESSEELKEGTYTINLEKSKNSVSYGIFKIGVDYSNNTTQKDNFLISGTVIIKITDNEYEVEIDAKTHEDKNLQVYYKGGIPTLNTLILPEGGDKINKHRLSSTF